LDRGFVRSLARRARTWPVVAAVAATVLVVAAVWIGRVSSQRGAAMRAAAEASSAAVAEARAAGGMTWAPAELASAERAWRDALTLQRLEEARRWPLRDAERVVAAHGAAQRAARQVAEIGRQRREAAAAAAASAIRIARVAVSSSETLAATIRLQKDRLHVLSQARGALREAEVYAREADFGTAAARAREAATFAAQVRDHAADVAARYADAETLARWRRWKDDTIAWSRRQGAAAIIVSKEAHTLTLYVRGVAVRSYRVEMGPNWIADKRVAGDDATPEGRYHVIGRRSGGASVYHKALLLDYPNAEDRAQFSKARRAGTVPATAGIGGSIEIHGEGGRGRDWTEGCVAMTNADIDDLFARVGIGTPVTIVGSEDYGAIADFAAQHRTSGARRP
jgi:lipoprotein-anchoring transpeptidase ErfK/SrfK